MRGQKRPGQPVLLLYQRRQDRLLSGGPEHGPGILRQGLCPVRPVRLLLAAVCPGLLYGPHPAAPGGVRSGREVPHHRPGERGLYQRPQRPGRGLLCRGRFPPALRPGPGSEDRRGRPPARQRGDLFPPGPGAAEHLLQPVRGQAPHPLPADQISRQQIRKRPHLTGDAASFCGIFDSDSFHFRVITRFVILKRVNPPKSRPGPPRSLPWHSGGDSPLGRGAAGAGSSWPGGGLTPPGSGPHRCGPGARR